MILYVYIDLLFLLLEIYPTEILTQIHKDIRKKKLFTVALFVTTTTKILWELLNYDDFIQLNILQMFKVLHD